MLPPLQQCKVTWLATVSHLKTCHDAPAYDETWKGVSQKANQQHISSQTPGRLWCDCLSCDFCMTMIFFIFFNHCGFSANGTSHHNDAVFGEDLVLVVQNWKSEIKMSQLPGGTMTSWGLCVSKKKTTFQLLCWLNILCQCELYGSFMLNVRNACGSQQPSELVMRTPNPDQRR